MKMKKDKATKFAYEIGVLTDTSNMLQELRISGKNHNYRGLLYG